MTYCILQNLNPTTPSVHEQNFKNLEAEKGMENLNATVETNKYRQNQSSKTRNYRYTNKVSMGNQVSKIRNTIHKLDIDVESKLVNAIYIYEESEKNIWK